MKKVLFLTLALLVASCANDKEAGDDFTPTPGMKNCCEKPTK